MPISSVSQSSVPKASQATLPHQVYSGTTWHHRLLPAKHKFAYPYRYWGINISVLARGEALPEVGLIGSSKQKRRLPLFSSTHPALQQFCAEDYLTAHAAPDPNDLEHTADAKSRPAQALAERLKKAFLTQTGSCPTGEMMGMLVCRNAGMYFSPVNFYIGFDEAQTPTHLLAEVSNTPWNKRHYYGFALTGADSEFFHDKDFHVSPFNPIDQQYRWQVRVKKQADATLDIRIAIDISDVRGEVLKTGIQMRGQRMTEATIKNSLRKNPLMNLSSLARIYGHAFKLYVIKKVPYINYDETLEQSKS